MRCPSDIRASININSTALANWTKPIATDNSNLEPNVTVIPAGITPPHIFYETTLAVYTATDEYGNKDECKFKVMLEGKPNTHGHVCSIICRQVESNDFLEIGLARLNTS